MNLVEINLNSKKKVGIVIMITKSKMRKCKLQKPFAGKRNITLNLSEPSSSLSSQPLAILHLSRKAE